MAATGGGPDPLERCAAALERIAAVLERFEASADSEAPPEPPADACAHPEAARINNSVMGRERWKCGLCGFSVDRPFAAGGN